MADHAPSLRGVVAGVAVVLGLLLLAGPAAAQGSTVDVLEVDGVLDPSTVSYLLDGLDGAAERDSSAVVIQLDSPGALGGDVGSLVEAIRTSTVPVVVYVGPPGGMAAGAAVEVAAASHVLALAPATVFGAAVPSDLGELADGEAVAARLVELAAERGRNPGFAAEAATDGRVVVAVPDGESGVAVADSTDFPVGADRATATTLDGRDLATAGIAEIVAPTLQGVLFQLDGRRVRTAAGPVLLRIDPATAEVRFVNADLVGRILHAAASPTLAYLLLLGGALALAFEVFQPGFGVAGYSAVPLLLLGAYAAFVLPTESWALAGMGLGLVLLGVDLAVAGLGIPSALGALLLGVGSWFAFEPPLRPPAWLIITGTVIAVAFFVIVMTSVLRAQGNQALLGAQGVTGKLGVVRSMLNPEGHVYVGGQLWRARAPEAAGKVKAGTKVRVLGLGDSLTLDVELVEDDAVPAGPGG